MNIAGLTWALRFSLGGSEEDVLGMNGWLLVGLSAASLGAATPPAANQGAVQLAQADVTTPTYAPAMDPWYGYKLRLATLARQQGVSASTIQGDGRV